jgi:signal transduction histidine kinase
MDYKYFNLSCILRIVLLTISIFTFVYLLTQTAFLATSMIVGVFILIQVFSLLHYVHKTNRDLARFLSAIRFSDFSQSFSSGHKETSFRSLNAAFSEVMSIFQQARAEKEEQYRYLNTVVQHVGLGLMSFNQDGEVDLINKAAKKLLSVTNLKNIKSLETFSPDLVITLQKLHPGQKALVKIEEFGEAIQLVIYATEFKLQDRAVKLVSMQNIESELAEQEMDAWQKLIRVLTHEIMNSVTPIASLASTVRDIISDSESKAADNSILISEESKEDIHQAVATIERRSQGLLHFIDSYRNLTRIPAPTFQLFTVRDLFNRISSLMDPQLHKNGIKLHVDIEPESLELTADRELIEQVLINLMINAIHAQKETGEKTIELTSFMNDRGRNIITVSDNGMGIEESVREKIFTPFFTTRKDGSGVGLSLSKQIMRLHKGSISVQSVPDQKTIFTLRF